ncbi:hypothetical protein EJ04DRAFT_475356 [Polyplosphaeria fusca]|uniref:Uncharacterized protein n=1 Tax=Polyplosphaeria fusca TaxID=682080 RepID=A0A9P4QN57_9PLEO|nr:hypothetical protein EJ04DRAFT_475356 [Polyplosphaeria fusca]
MCDSPSSPHFRLLHLPSEIRDKIYRELLCSFELAPADFCKLHFLDLEHLEHTVNTAILRTSKHVHLEAWDVMVKTNRFVKIVAEQGVPLRVLLNALNIPIVTAVEEHVHAIGGCVLSMHMSLKDQTEDIEEDELTGRSIHAPCSVILLWRHLSDFTKSVWDGDAHLPGFSKNIIMSITVAPPPLPKDLPPYKASLETFFSEKTQQTLLEPFRTVKGLKNVHISGAVSPHIAEDVQAAMAQDEWIDGKVALEKAAADKQRGIEAFRRRDVSEASIIWMDTVEDIERLYRGSSWNPITEQADNNFVIQVAEMYLTLKLNIALVNINAMQGDPFANPIQALMSESALKSARLSCLPGYWKKNFNYTPPDSLMAKLMYRSAMNWRELDEPDRQVDALVSIERALRLSPDDPAIIREREKISRWVGADMP